MSAMRWQGVLSRNGKGRGLSRCSRHIFGLNICFMVAWNYRALVLVTQVAPSSPMFPTLVIHLPLLRNEWLTICYFYMPDHALNYTFTVWLPSENVSSDTCASTCKVKGVTEMSQWNKETMVLYEGSWRTNLSSQISAVGDHARNEKGQGGISN